MIAVGDKAPAFQLKDQFERLVDSETSYGCANTMFLFYPLDWTPT